MLKSNSSGDSENMSTKALVQLPLEESKNYNITFLLLRDIVNQSVFCDVKILSGTKEIAIHKCLFGCISKYMENMFEKMENGTATLRVDDSEEFSNIEAFVNDIYIGMLRDDNKYGKISEDLCLDGGGSKIDLDLKIRQLLNGDRLGTKTFCDGVILTETRGFPVHRCVVAVHADYFATIFANAKMNENCPAVCHLTWVEDDVLAAVLDFMYTKEMRIGAEQFSNFLPAVDALGIACLQGDRLTDRLLDMVSTDNKMDMWLIGKKFEKEKLVNRAKELIVSGHFSNLANISWDVTRIDKVYIKDFLELVKDVVTSDRLCDLIMQWININVKERVDMFDVLFTNVDSTQLTDDAWKTLLKEEELLNKSFTASKAALAYTKRFLPNDEDKVASTSAAAGDSPLTDSVLIYGVCGDTNSVYRWDLPVLAHCDMRGNSFMVPHWTSMECVDDTVGKISGRRNFSLVYGGGILYCIGGYHGRMIYATNEVLSCNAHGKWSVEPSMIEKRQNAAALYHAGKIYVAGGMGCNRKQLNSIECYYRGQWTMLCPMLSCRTRFAFFPHNGLLHVIGGVGRSGAPVLTHDVYSLANSSWETRASYDKRLTNIKLTTLSRSKAYIVNAQSRDGSKLRLYTFDLDTFTVVTEDSAITTAIKRCATFVLSFPDLETCLLQVRRNSPRRRSTEELTV